MNRSIKISLIASTAIMGSLFFTGCGSSSSSNNTSTVSLNKIVGSVTASKFEDAMVYVDVDGSGDYTVGDSEIACTDKNGEFSLDYVVDENTSYIIMAENQDGSIYCEGPTIRYLDNDTNETNPEFMMYISYEANNTKAEVNPINFINYLKKIREGDDIEILEGETNADLFAKFVKGKKGTIKGKLSNIKVSKDVEEQSKNLELSKDDLELDKNVTLSFDKSDKSSVELANIGLYKEQSIPAKIGNLVVSLPLNEIGVISDDNNIPIEDINSSQIDDGVSAVKVQNSGSTANNLILKKPIFSVINDKTNGIKLIIGNKSNIQDLGDITLSITPYEDILTIPEYSSLRDEYNATVILGADITVEDSNGKRISANILSDVNKTIAGVVLDKHSEIESEGLKYYYFNGETWIEDGNITKDGSLNLNDKFRLVPYVIAKPNDMKPITTITVDGLDNVKEPVVVAKANINSLQSTNSKILYKDLGDSLVVDATADVNGNEVSFRIPNGYNIDEIVVLGEKLNKVTTDKKNSVAISVQSGSTKTSLESSLPIITDTDLVDHLSSKLLSNLHIEDLYGNFELPYYGYSESPTKESSDKQKAYYILGINIANFIGKPKTEKNSFYSGSDIDAPLTLSWVDKYDNNSTKRERTLSVDSSTKTLTRTEKNYDYSSGNLKFTRTQTLKFKNNTLIKATTKTYSSNDIGDEIESYNKSGTVYNGKQIYNKVDDNTTNITFETDIPVKKVSKYSYGDTTSQTTISNYLANAGKAAVQFDSLFSKITKVYSSEYTQQFNKVKTFSDSNLTEYASVNGKITTDANDTINFEGSYKLTISDYGTIEGDSIVDNGKFVVNFSDYEDDYINSNSILDTTKVILRSTQTIQENEQTPENIQSNSTIIVGTSSKIVEDGSLGTVLIENLNSNFYKIAFPISKNNINVPIKLGFDLTSESTKTNYKIGIDEFSIDNSNIISNLIVNVCVSSENEALMEYKNGCKNLPVSNIMSLENEIFSINAQAIVSSFGQSIPTSDNFNMSVYMQNLCSTSMNPTTNSFSVNSIDLSNSCNFNFTLTSDPNKLMQSAKVLQAVDDLENFNISQNSLSDKLKTIKSDLGSTHKDEVTLKSFIDLALIYNDTDIANLIDTNSTASSTMNKIVDHLDNPVNISLELSNSPSIVNTISKINTTADQLKIISDGINDAFSDQTYVMKYSSDQNITYNDSLITRATALFNAGILKFIGSYTYGSQSLYDIKTHTDGVSTYRTIDIDEKSVLNDTTFFKLNSTELLQSSKDYLKESVELFVQVDTTKIDDPIDAQDVSDAKVDAQKILNAMNGTGVFTDGNISLNINNLFSSDYYIDREDFGSNLDYTCIYDPNQSVLSGEPICTDGTFAQLEASTMVGVDSSTFDEVFLKLEDNGTVYSTPIDIIENFANSF